MLVGFERNQCLRSHVSVDCWLSLRGTNVFEVMFRATVRRVCAKQTSSKPCFGRLLIGFAPNKCLRSHVSGDCSSGLRGTNVFEVVFWATVDRVCSEQTSSKSRLG